ncbi:BnaCnng42540D [Brassica napus]|uniref:BnaCnng42540D protein n=1 Tax=Brassica napus TaxID=3708 RepID=A0A078JEN1_BRANA|nr:BnaCnng42540D [Brassica napus]
MVIIIIWVFKEAKPFHVKEVEYVMLTVSSFNNKKDDLSHCLDLMLEDIGKLEPVKNALKKCIFMSGYIYYRVPLVNMMRRFTNQHNLHRPAAKKLKRYILQESFWRNVAYALKLTGPLVKVLSMLNRLLQGLDTSLIQLSTMPILKTCVVKKLRLVCTTVSTGLSRMVRFKIRCCCSLICLKKLLVSLGITWQ